MTDLLSTALRHFGLSLGLAGCLAAAAPSFAQTAPATQTPAQTPAESIDKADAGAYLAARIAAYDSNFRAAAKWFERALLKDPDNAQLLDGATMGLIGLGEFDKAAITGARQVELGQISVGAGIALIVKDAKAGDFATLAALPESRSAGKLADDLVKAWSKFGQGNMTEAVAAFDTIANTEGLKPFGLYHKALALSAVGDFEGAEDILSGRASGPMMTNKRGVIAHVQILSQLEKNDLALETLNSVLGTEPDPQLDEMRAKLEAGEMLDYDRANTAAEGIAETFFTLAAALNGEAEPGYTVLFARAAMDLHPAHDEAILLSAALLQQLEQFDLAGEVYAQIKPDNPVFYSAEIGRAETLFEQDRKDEALAVLKGLTEKLPKLSIVHMAYADALRRQEKYAEAGEAYTAALETITVLEPRHWGLYYSRGVARERSGDWDGSVKDLRKALELNPDRPEVLNYLGYSFVDRGENYDEALAMIERAVKLRPDAGYIIDSLAWALYRLGRHAEALPKMEEASLLEPVDPVVTDHLGDVYWVNGRQTEARFQWRRALSFQPTDKDAERIRLKLDIGLDEVLTQEGGASKPDAQKK